VLALFVVSGLYPGKQVELPNDRGTDDQFVVVLDASQADFQISQTRDLLASHSGFAIEETIEKESREKKSHRKKRSVAA
jgi:hypothetical protein